MFLLFALMAGTVAAQNTETKQAAPQQENNVWVPEKVVPVAEHYDGGQEAMYKAIYEELSYPPMAKRHRVQGDCIIGFTVNEDGSTSNFKVIRTQGAGTGEEALRVAKLLKFKAPGYRLDASIPIMFKL